MEESWLAGEIERTKKIIEAMPHGEDAVRHAAIRAEERNRAESEDYAREQKLRGALNSKAD